MQILAAIATAYAPQSHTSSKKLVLCRNHKRERRDNKGDSKTQNL